MITGMGLSLIWFVLGVAFHMSADEAIKKAETEEKEVSESIREDGDYKDVPSRRRKPTGIGKTL